ncbi:hypothetical protein QCA50_012365 [Cerrena zonata]|uniref:DUF6535 domain-containing protein n=1 Tax=Cerrena zonata TaxID=2478898 RepID=A0AAW0FTP9_9APHY
MASRSPSPKNHGSRKRRNRAKSLPASAPISSADNDQSQAIKRANSWPRSGNNETQLEDLQREPLNIKPKDVHPSTTRKDESTGLLNSVQRVKIEPERTGWAKLYDLVRQFDKDRVEDIRDDIDTLLVFAGLFSAVVTAFIIESYKNLQPQSDDTSAQVLLHISAQLASLSLNGNFINSTISSFTPTPFPRLPSSILINTLWSSSLVIALITASIGILVKQWFHELMAYTTHDPQERLKLRFFRERGLERWKVFAIASSLPVLLQLALILFFIGLAVFLHQLDSIVGWTITGIMISWLMIFTFTTFTPAFSSQCPYKTPMLKGLLTQLRCLPISLKSFGVLGSKFEQWSNKVKALEEEQVSKDGSLSMPIIVCAKDLLRGERLNDPVRECFRTISAKDMGATFQEWTKKQSPVDSGLIPDVSYGMMKEMSRVILAEIGDKEQWSMHLGEDSDLSYFPKLCFSLTLALSGTYNSASGFPISSTHLPTFIRLIREGPTSAAFSILTMYSVRHHTLMKHPEKYDGLFPTLSDIEKQNYGIGDQFVSNLIAATRTLIHTLWKKPQPGSDIQNVVDCITQIQNDDGGSDSGIPLDPIALIDIFAKVIWDLIFGALAKKHQDGIYEVMGELADIMSCQNQSFWTQSYKKSVRHSRIFFRLRHLADRKLIPKLKAVGQSWNSESYV